MANIASTDVTYTIAKQKKMDDSRKIVNASLAFGDGALTYPAGGVPVLKGSLGCPQAIDSFMIEDLGGSGYVYQYDKANYKIRIFQSQVGGGVLAEVTGVAIAAQTIKVTIIGY